jgi:hypothetical protein
MTIDRYTKTVLTVIAVALSRSPRAWLPSRAGRFDTSPRAARPGDGAHTK